MANIFQACGSSRKILTDSAFFSCLSRFNLSAKRFILKTVPQYKCPSDKDKCLESLNSSTKNPCQSISNTQKDDSSAATFPSKNLCGKSSETSSKHCVASSTNSGLDSEAPRYFKSAVDDPCSRDCNISSPPVYCPNTCSKEEACPEPPPDICSPTEETARKMRFWRNACIFVALPIVFLSSIIISNRAKEEARKPRPEFVPMDYLYIRTKRFPWGDGNHTFFHNPERNAVPPDGYEVEDPNAVIKGE